MFDYLIVGAGLFGSVFAQQKLKQGKSVLVIDKREHIAGNCYTETRDNIYIHKYGPHIFHTSSEQIWNYVNEFCSFIPYTYSPVARYQERNYSLPFNMNTFAELWGVKTEQEAVERINKTRYLGEITNLEEYALSMVGQEVYEKLIYGYTKKQWMKEPKDLPSSILKRIPIRFEFNNNYYNDVYQGIPSEGYTKLCENLLNGATVELGIDFFKHKDDLLKQSKFVVYTGKIDEFFDYEFGKLDYRSLRFEESVLPIKYHQSASVINYTDHNVPYTRIIEHKHFNDRGTQNTVLTKEYPIKYSDNNIPYYPINDVRNQSIFDKYNELTKLQSKVIFGGRLAEYRYYDMHQIIGSALKKAGLTDR